MAAVSSTILKSPSALVPLVMSAGALAVALSHIALHGTAPQADEGAAAHSWQLLMVGQVPFVLYFAARHLPDAPRQTTRVLGLQIAAAIAAAAPVFVLGW